MFHNSESEKINMRIEKFVYINRTRKLQRYLSIKMNITLLISRTIIGHALVDGEIGAERSQCRIILTCPDAGPKYNPRVRCNI